MQSYFYSADKQTFPRFFMNLRSKGTYPGTRFFTPDFKQTIDNSRSSGHPTGKQNLTWEPECERMEI